MSSAAGLFSAREFMDSLRLYACGSFEAETSSARARTVKGQRKTIARWSEKTSKKVGGIGQEIRLL